MRTNYFPAILDKYQRTLSIIDDQRRVTKSGAPSMTVSQPLLHKDVVLQAPSHVGVRVVALLAALALCLAMVGISRRSQPGADELYLQLPMVLSPGAIAAENSRLFITGSTMLAAAVTSSSVLDARKEQVKEDSAEMSADEGGNDREDSASAKARRVRGREADDARGREPPLTDVDDDARKIMHEGADDGYVHDIDIAPRKSLAIAAVPRTSLAKAVAGAAQYAIKAYDPTATASLTKSSRHSGQCRRFS